MTKFAKLLAAALTLASSMAQETAPLPDPLVVREKVREWVRTQQLISEERADWEAEKASLTDLNALRKKEIAQLDEILAAAGDRATDAVAQQTTLLAESESLKAARSDFAQAIGDIESKTRALIPYFPAPLLTKVDDSLAGLEATEGASLQDRYRGALAILREAVAFQNRLTLDSEMREVDGETREIRVLYLGLAQAYYVDRSGNHAGTGIPTASGWQWTEANPLAGSIAETIAVFEKSAAPKLVALPLQIDAE